MFDKIENSEPPPAHMIPDGAEHIVLPVASIIALAAIDWRLSPASLATFPLSFICMALTFKISGKNFSKYDETASLMNSTCGYQPLLQNCNIFFRYNFIDKR